MTRPGPHSHELRARTSHERTPRRADPRRALGRRGEQIAAEHLCRLGFELLERNVRTRYGEIDLIAFDGKTLVIVEVKTRRVRDPNHGLHPDNQPLSGLRSGQRARLRRLACAWLYDGARERPHATEIRFDAIGVTVDRADRLLRLDHLEGAW